MAEEYFDVVIVGAGLSKADINRSDRYQLDVSFSFMYRFAFLRLKR